MFFRKSKEFKCSAVAYFRLCVMTHGFTLHRLKENSEAVLDSFSLSQNAYYISPLKPLFLATLEQSKGLRWPESVQPKCYFEAVCGTPFKRSSPSLSIFVRVIERRSSACPFLLCVTAKARW